MGATFYNYLKRKRIAEKVESLPFS